MFNFLNGARTKIGTPKIAIALILLLAATSVLITMPTAKADDIPTFAFIAVAPNPSGVNQPVTVAMWLSMTPITASGLEGDRWTFNVDVTKPDGTTQKLGTYTSDAVGSAYTTFTPTEIGTYTFQMSFPGQHITGWDSYRTRQIDNYYQPSTSKPATLVVQQEQIEPWEETPLPTGPWSRPINSENREWSQISGNWLQFNYNASFATRFGHGGGFNPYTTAPNSAHIVWTKPLDFGGIVGGEYGSVSYYTGQSYENKWQSPIIINGRLFYNQRLGSSAYYGAVCVDLRTGEEIWRKANMSINTGQVLDYETFNQHGAIPYLWTTTGNVWKMYDAFTGELILTVENLPQGTAGMFSPISSATIIGEDGSLIIYMLDGTNNWLSRWNSTTAISPPTSAAWGVGQWRPPFGGKVNWTDGLEWNVTIPDVPGTQSITRVGSDIILATSHIKTTPPTVVHIGYDMKTGQQLWMHNRTNQYDSETTTFNFGLLLNGVYTEYIKEKMQWVGYSATTGEQLWESDSYDTSAWGMYMTTIGAYSCMAYDKFYATAYDGCVHCFDLNDGKELWTYYVGSSGLETVYGTWPLWGSIIAADHKIYATTGEHSPSTPLPRGEALHCINADTGQGVWSISGMFEGLGVADGYLVGFNGYDNQLYCFGKGPTQLTVEAPLTSVAKGQGMIIQGKIIDTSAGAKAKVESGEFNIIPAISDKDQTAWMEHIYMQKPLPEDVTGVPITIYATDANGNTEQIATVTSDASGLYYYKWVPSQEGVYKITAVFDGSESYWASSATTAITIDQAASAPITPTQPTQPVISPTPAVEPESGTPTETLLILGASIIIIAIIVPTAILLKRRK
jgi:hypothetical protein